MAAKRRLFDIDVQILSIVKAGANRKKIIFKSKDAPENPPYERIIPILKINDELHTVYGIVYSPGEEDTDGDFTTVEEIRKASENFMKLGRTAMVDKDHNFVTDEGFISENWITKDNDSTFPKDPIGSWATGIKVEKEETWQQVKNGELTGISLAGFTKFEEVKPVEKSNLFKAIYDKVTEIFVPYVDQDIEKAGKVLSASNFKSIQGIITTLQSILDSVNPTEENKMDKTELMKILKEDKDAQDHFSGLINAAVEKATKPLTNEIAALKTDKQTLTDANKALADRLAIVEKNTPDPQNKKQQDIKKSDEQSFAFVPVMERPDQE